MATLKKNSLVNYVGTVYDLKNPCKVMRDTDTDLTVQLEDMNGIEQRVSGGYVEPLENSDQEDTSDRFMEGAHVNYIGDNEDWANPCILDMLDDNGSVARIIDNDGEVGYVPLTDLVQFKVGDKVEYTGLMHVIDEPVTVVEADPSKDFIQAETSDGDVKTMNIKNLKLVEDGQEDAEDESQQLKFKLGDKVNYINPHRTDVVNPCEVIEVDDDAIPYNIKGVNGDTWWAHEHSLEHADADEPEDAEEPEGFTVGDDVRIIETGVKGTIKQVDEGLTAYPYLIKFETGYEQWFRREQIATIKQPSPTVTMEIFTVGDKVTLLNQHLGLFEDCEIVGYAPGTDKPIKLKDDWNDTAWVKPEDIEAVEQTEGTDQDDEPEAEQNQDTEATDQEAQTEEPDQQDEEPEFSFNIGDRVELVFRPDWIGTVIETSSETVHPYRVQFDNNITALYEKFDLRPHEDDQQDEPQGVYIPAIDDPKPKHSKVKLTQLMQYGSPIIVNNEDTPEALTEDTEEPDMVNHPPHYNIHNMETIDAIEQTMTPDEVRGYYKGNIKKYTDRYRYKDGMKDLGKLVFYSKRLEAFEEKLGELK